MEWYIDEDDQSLSVSIFNSKILLGCFQIERKCTIYLFNFIICIRSVGKHKVSAQFISSNSETLQDWPERCQK